MLLHYIFAPRPPAGKHFVLTDQGKAALAVFLLAGTWWVFEVVPIGVTGITIGVVQALFHIREPRVAFTDFMTEIRPVDRDDLRRLASLGDRVLFGSDFPLLGAKRYFEEMRAAGLSTEEMAAVCGGNAQRLFSLGG